MFEIEDRKLGRLKVFNVTEARAHFAAVLKEDQAKVVITRHGRPSKILINYEEYVALMRNYSLESPSEKHPIPLISSNTPALPGRWTEEDLHQIVKSITSGS
jgi:prevent-host-death family protein